MINDLVLASEWIPVCRISQVIDQPMKITVVGEHVVVFRTEEGVHALKDVCIHRGAPLSLGKVKDNCLVCPYHGWAYSKDGKCTKIPQLSDKQAIPPKAHTQSYSCIEKYGLIWVNLMDQNRHEPVFVESDDPSFQVMSIGPYSVQATGPRLIENFLDVGHLAFLHEGYLGDSQFPHISDYQVHWLDDRWISDEITIIQPNADGRGKTIYNDYIYEILSATIVRFRKTDKATGDTVSIMMCVLPSEELRSSAFFLIACNFEVDKAEFIAFQEFIFGQDIEILQNQKPEELPLDLQAELHLKSDRMSIAYRKYLVSLGVTWGVHLGR